MTSRSPKRPLSATPRLPIPPLSERDTGELNAAFHDIKDLVAAGRLAKNDVIKLLHQLAERAPVVTPP